MIGKQTPRCPLLILSEAAPFPQRMSGARIDVTRGQEARGTAVDNQSSVLRVAAADSVTVIWIELILCRPLGESSRWRNVMLSHWDLVRAASDMMIWLSVWQHMLSPCDN